MVNKITQLLFFLVLFQFFCSAQLFALENPQTQLQEVGVNPELGSIINLDARFTNASGQERSIREYMLPNKPLIIVPAYYHCPRLCGLTLNGVVKLLNQLHLSLGADYKILTISFDSAEGPSQALERQQHFRGLLAKADTLQGWEFLVGTKDNVVPLMQQLGFKYYPDQGEFAHTSAILLLTPDAKISQYFTGIDFPAFDVKLALVEASLGNIGSMLDHALLFCFRFDATKGKYTWAAFGLLKIGGVLTLLFLTGLISFMLLREKRSRLISEL